MYFSANSTSIKRFRKILIILLAVILLPPLILFFAIRFPAVQTYVVQKLTGILEKELKTEIYVESVHYHFFNKLNINNIYMLDHQMDTIISLDQLQVGIGFISLKEKDIYLTDVQLNHLEGYFYKDSLNQANYRFLIDALASDSVKGDPYRIRISDLDIRDSRIRYLKFGSLDKEFGMNYNKLDFRISNLEVDDFLVKGDSILMEVEEAAVKESCGAEVMDFDSELLILPQSIRLGESVIVTPHSYLKLENLILNFESINDLSDFTNRVRMDGQLKNSLLGFEDLWYFSPSLRGMTDSVQVSGYFNGIVPYLNTRYAQIQFGRKSLFKGDVQFIGLGQTDDIFIHAEIDQMHLDVIDLSNIQLPYTSSQRYAVFPEIVHQLGYLDYAGYFTGLLNDFVAYGTVSSYIGSISTDIKFREEKEKAQIQYSGKVKTKDLHLGELFKEEKWLGKTDLEFEVDGYQSGKSIKSTIDGTIARIEINQYPLQNIEVKGLYEDELFDGFVDISDQNLALEFTGSVDFRNKIPRFSFSSVVDKLNLLAFGINAGDSISQLKFDLLSNFKGNELDNFEGEVFIWDLEYQENQNRLIVEEIAVNAQREANQSQLDIQSTAADLNMSGNYRFNDLANLFLNFVNGYLPSLDLGGSKVIYDQSFTFDLKIKDAQDIFSTLTHGFMLADGTTASGKLNSLNSELICNLNIPFIEANPLKGKSIQTSIQSNNKELRIKLDSKELSLFQDLNFQHFKLESVSSSDSSNLRLNWKNDGLQNNSGRISAGLTIDNRLDSRVDIRLDPSLIYLADSLWNLESSGISYTKEGLRIQDFKFRNDKQYLNVHGMYSFSKPDSLYIDFHQISLNLLDPITKEYDLSANGILEGEATIISGLENPLFFAELMIDGFGLNDEVYGLAQLSTYWNDTSSALNLSGAITRGNLKPVLLNGEYYPGDGGLNFILTLDKFQLANLQPFAQDLVSNITGIASNKLYITGTLREPTIQGELKIQKASMLVDYLQTTYYFSDLVYFSKDTIRINKLTLNDQQNNTANVNGFVSHRNYSDWNLNFVINTPNLQFLNTEVIHNTSYYGKAFASGTIAIYGPLNEIKMDINAITQPGTKFNIPLYTESSLTTNSFIRFVKPLSADTLAHVEEQPELASSSNILLNFNLEVTPDAEVQLIFDDKVGDIIKGVGRSNLKMEVNTAGDFTMFGDFEIIKGDYLFTLANFLSRKFKIKEGGIIRWTGDPYEAQTDLLAYYDVVAPLKDLMGDTNEIYRKKLNIDCIIGMTGQILQPEMKLSIQLPPEAEGQQALLDNLPENELNKQFFSLLVINQFQPLMGLSLLGNSASGSSVNIGQSASEFLSNQLSHWVSQISTNFDVGFTYRPGDQISTDEVEVALRTQLFNDYLIINGNFGYGGQYATANTIVGDVEAEVKITKNGKIKMTAFNKTNTNLDYEKGPYTRGVGVFFREEFNSLEELFKRYFFKKKEEDGE